MKIISKTSSALLLCLLTAVLPTLVMAQGKPVSTMPPPPSNLEKIEDSAEPAISIKKPESGKSKMTEKRVNGKVTEVEVQSGKSHYVVKANPEVGNAPKGTAQGDSNRAAQWTLLEFGGKKESKDVEPVPVLAPAADAAKTSPASASMPAKK